MPNAHLQLESDGKLNVLRIRRGPATGVCNIVLDFCKDLPRNQNDAEVNSHRHVINRIAQSTDFVCSYANCSYHHKSESRYILHARSHFVFEVAFDAVYDTAFKCNSGKYTCSKCPRLTTDWISFREHVRHHIFEKPYKCSLCMLAIASVPELRIHFQKHHAGKETDFVFNGSVDELNTVLSALLPEAIAVTDSLNICFKAPATMATRISSTPVSGVSHPVCLLQQILNDNRCTAKQRDKNTVVDHDAVVEELPGKYEYDYGMYKCTTCGYSTRKETVFSRHAWKHIHGSWKSTCTHNIGGTLSGECAIVNGLIDVLKKVDFTRTIDRFQSVSAHIRASEAVDNGCPVLPENSKYCISCSAHTYSYCQKVHIT